MVESSTSDKTINYVVFGRTGEIYTNTTDDNSFVFEIKFMALAWMVPQAEVLIYYIHHTGEVVYDQVTVKFEGSLPNKVSITTERVYHFFFLPLHLIFIVEHYSKQ